MLEATALPNLHPALVHFPIALATTALLFDVVLLARRLPQACDGAAAALWLLAAAGAGAAYLSGERAHEALGDMAPAVHAAVESHEEAALPTAVALGVLALLRLAVAWRERTAPAPSRTPLRWIALALGLAAQGLVLRTADRGGALVYRHGIGVEAVAAPQPAAAAGHGRHQH